MVKAPPKPPFRSFLTYGPKWPYYRTNADTGNRYRWCEDAKTWLFSAGPEGEGL